MSCRFLVGRRPPRRPCPTLPPGEGRGEGMPRNSPHPPALPISPISPSPLLLFSPSPLLPVLRPPSLPNRAGFSVECLTSRRDSETTNSLFSPTGIVAIPRMVSSRPRSSADLFAGQPLRPRQPFDERSSRRNEVAPSRRHGFRLTDASWQKVLSPGPFLARSPFFHAILGKKPFLPGDSWHDVRFPGRLLVTVHEESAKVAGTLRVPSAAASAVRRTPSGSLRWLGQV